MCVVKKFSYSFNQLKQLGMGRCWKSLKWKFKFEAIMIYNFILSAKTQNVCSISASITCKFIPDWLVDNMESYNWLEFSFVILSLITQLPDYM